MTEINKISSSIPDSLVKVMRSIVADVSAEVTPKIQRNDAAIIGKDSYITGIWYEHGHILEIVETLKQKDESDQFINKKYPLVALLQDYPDNGGDFGLNGSVTLHIVIVNYSTGTWKAEERQVKNFDPILQPIYDSLMKHIAYNPYFNEYSLSKIQKTKIDRMFWGRDGLYGVEGNVFEDKVDCIEIKDLQLKLSRTACKI